MFYVHLSFIFFLQLFIVLCIESNTSKTRINNSTNGNDFREVIGNLEDKFNKLDGIDSVSSSYSVENSDQSFTGRYPTPNYINSVPTFTSKTRNEIETTVPFGENAEVDKSFSSIATNKDFTASTMRIVSEAIESLQYTTLRNLKPDSNSMHKPNFSFPLNETLQFKAKEVGSHQNDGSLEVRLAQSPNNSDDSLLTMYKNLINGIGIYLKNEDSERGKRHKNISTEEEKMFQKNSDITFAKILSGAAKFFRSFIDVNNKSDFDYYTSSFGAGKFPKKERIVHGAIERPNSSYDFDDRISQTVLQDYYNDELIDEYYGDFPKPLFGSDNICKASHGRGDAGKELFDKQPKYSNHQTVLESPSSDTRHIQEESGSFVTSRSFNHIPRNMKTCDGTDTKTTTTESYCVARCKGEEMWINDMISNRLCKLFDGIKAMLKCDCNGNKNFKAVNRLAPCVPLQREINIRNNLEDDGPISLEQTTSKNIRNPNKNSYSQYLRASSERSAVILNKGDSEQIENNQKYNISQKERNMLIDNLQTSSIDYSETTPNPEAQTNITFFSDVSLKKEDSDYIQDEFQTSKPIAIQKFHGIPIVAITEVSRNFYVPIQHAFPSKINSQSKFHNRNPGVIIGLPEQNSNLEPLVLKLRSKHLKDREPVIFSESKKYLNELSNTGNVLRSGNLKTRSSFMRRNHPRRYAKPLTSFMKVPKTVRDS